MNRALAVAACLITLIAARPVTAQTSRIASDFEIERMEKLAATEPGFLAQIAAHLNLGNLRSTRNETALAAREYTRALAIAEDERSSARRDSDLARYATATMYAGLALAELNRPERAFEYEEEATRYGAADGKTWNMVASAMGALGQPRKAASAARNAVSIAAAAAKRAPTAPNLLDLAIYQYSLATALDASGGKDEAIQLLQSAIETLRSKSFDRMRKEMAKNESFEIYSTARGEQAAYRSALNRSQLKLAEIYEASGNSTAARKAYEDVLAGRSDEAAALEGLSRLAGSPEERQRAMSMALDANPFAIETVRAYQRFLATEGASTGKGNAAATGGAGSEMRRALEQMQRGEDRAARTTLDELAAGHPGNDVVQYLSALVDLRLGDADRARGRVIHLPELSDDIRSRLARGATRAPAWLDGAGTAATPTAAELRHVLALTSADRLSPAQRSALDRIVLSSPVAFEPPETPPSAGQTLFVRGTVEGVAFTFAQPTAFRGEYKASDPLRLDYRILGATETGGVAALLLEPLKIEVMR